MAQAPVNQAKVFGALVASFPLAYLLFQGQMKLLGNPPPITSEKEWEASTRLLNLSKEMQGNPDNPVLLNPFRTGVPATIRSKADMPSLESDS
jgi:hypothetical protein